MRFLKTILTAFLFVLVSASTLASHVHAGPRTGFEPQYLVGQPTAESRSLLDPSRIQFAVGIQRAWYTGTLPVTPQDEWEGVIASSYNVIPNLDAVASVARGFTSDEYRWTAGIRAVIFRGVK